MALNVVALAPLATAISSEAVAGKDGFLATYAPFGLNNVVKNANNSSDSNSASVRAVRGQLSSERTLHYIQHWIEFRIGFHINHRVHINM